MSRFFIIAFLLLSTACSPLYVIRAGWEEAGILLRREEITKIIKDKNTTPEVREKLSLVLKAREYSKSIGLVPNDSFTQYSHVDRKVLVWVLSASPKTKLEPITWWYPIVGRVPYKGFFEKDDAMHVFNELKDDGNDVYLRPSAAFSTLGWFNDPLLSTMMDFGEISLVSTVFHELTHNTVWLPNHVPFNETLANVVGAVSTIQFFRDLDSADSERAKQAADMWNDEVVYSTYLAEVFKKLSYFYEESSKDKSLSNAEIIERRAGVFEELKTHWIEFEPKVKTNRYGNIAQFFNNAVLLSQKAYYERTWMFADLLKKKNDSIPDFLESIRSIIEESKEEGIDPYKVLDSHLSRLSGPLKEVAPSE